jgi:hypothetical protein
LAVVEMLTISACYPPVNCDNCRSWYLTRAPTDAQWGESHGCLAELRRTLPRDKIFYDRYLESEIMGPNMSARLQRIYHDESDLIVVFISAEYQTKEWCGLEWRAVQDIIKKRKHEDILPMRFDDTDVPGLFSIDGYVELRDRDPENVADLILERLELKRQKRRATGAEVKS